MLHLTHQANQQLFQLATSNAPDATLRSMVASSLFADSNWCGMLYASGGLGGKQMSEQPRLASEYLRPRPPNINANFGSAIRSLTNRTVITPQQLEILKNEALRSLAWLKPQYATDININIKQQEAQVILHISITTPTQEEVNFNAVINS